MELCGCPWLGAAPGELWNETGSKVPSKQNCSGVLGLGGFRDGTAPQTAQTRPAEPPDPPGWG